MSLEETEPEFVAACLGRSGFPHEQSRLRARAAERSTIKLQTAQPREVTALVSAPMPRRMYVNVRSKFVIASVVATTWFALSLYLALPWMRDLAQLADWALAIFIVGGIALVPGFMNSFLIVSLLLDRRPPRVRLRIFPPITILVAAFNERASIAATLRSIERQHYPGLLEVLVIDDGSTDNTAAIVASLDFSWLTLLRQPENLGKSAALNRGLAEARYPLIVTLDADSYPSDNALTHLVERYVGDPDNTRAVAGAMLVRNSRTNWITKMQEWDYFHGIAATKRMQSLFQGTLVAQGAFSVYDRQTLRDLGGWENCVGEDIVLTWAILEAGWRVGHAEDAVCFTEVPITLMQLIRQRKRWARGMIEAFRRHPRILFVPRLSTAFIWWDLFFPWLDLAFTLCFIPGIILAFFGYYWIAGPMTLLLLPVSMLMNAVMFHVSKKTFDAEGLTVRHNPWGFVLYVLGYSLVLQPASVIGYLAELFGMRKTWGTK